MSTSARGDVVAVIFDMDGLLLDTEAIYTEAMQSVLHRFGKSLDRGLRQQMVGLGARALAASVVATLSLPLAGVSLLVVNAIEAEMMGSPAVNDLATAEAATFFLLERLGTSAVVTAGRSGAAWISQNGEHGSVGGRRVDVISTLGAGDAFIGHLASSLVGGALLGAAVATANEAAAKHISGSS